VVDFSHGNCQKQHRRQLDVCDDVPADPQRFDGRCRDYGGEFPERRHAKIVSGQPMVYGQSITDPCLNWEDTELLVENSPLRLIAVFNAVRRAISLCPVLILCFFPDCCAKNVLVTIISQKRLPQICSLMIMIIIVTLIVIFKHYVTYG
jgi:hypothetical protein